MIRMKMNQKFGDSSHWPNDNILDPKFARESQDQTYWRLRRFYEEQTKDVTFISERVRQEENRWLKLNPWLKQFISYSNQ